MTRQTKKKLKPKEDNIPDDKTLLYWENTPEQEDDIPQEIRPCRNMSRRTGAHCD
jgi:hypothetical protein